MMQNHLEISSKIQFWTRSVRNWSKSLTESLRKVYAIFQGPVQEDPIVLRICSYCLNNVGQVLGFWVEWLQNRCASWRLFGRFWGLIFNPEKNIVLKIVLRRFEKLFFSEICVLGPQISTPKIQIVLQNCFVKLYVF